MDQEQELKNTFLEEYASALLLKKVGNVKSAVILLSKELFAICDYIILKKYNKLPKNHTDRFRILELKEKILFIRLDSVWSKYTDTYSKPSTEDSFKILNDLIMEILQNERCCEQIKKPIGQ